MKNKETDKIKLSKIEKQKNNLCYLVFFPSFKSKDYRKVSPGCFSFLSLTECRDQRTTENKKCVK